MGYSTYATILVCAVFSVSDFLEAVPNQNAFAIIGAAYLARPTVPTVFQISLFTDDSKPEAAPEIHVSKVKLEIFTSRLTLQKTNMSKIVRIYDPATGKIGCHSVC